MQTHSAREIAEAMIYHQKRRTSIYNSLYAAVLGLVPHPTDNHPGYDDVIVTYAAPRRPMPDPQAKWMDYLMANEEQS